MAEYIEREALQRCRFIQDELGEWILAEDIINLPAADVRPVVFCKDCVHFIRGELFGDMVCDYHYLHQYHAEPNEFCSHAEKREES